MDTLINSSASAFLLLLHLDCWKRYHLPKVIGIFNEYFQITWFLEIFSPFCSCHYYKRELSHHCITFFFSLFWFAFISKGELCVYLCAYVFLLFGMNYALTSFSYFSLGFFISLYCSLYRKIINLSIFLWTSSQFFLIYFTSSLG